MDTEAGVGVKDVSTEGTGRKVGREGSNGAGRVKDE